MTTTQEPRTETQEQKVRRELEVRLKEIEAEHILEEKSARDYYDTRLKEAMEVDHAERNLPPSVKTSIEQIAFAYRKMEYNAVFGMTLSASAASVSLGAILLQALGFVEDNEMIKSIALNETYTMAGLGLLTSGATYLSGKLKKRRLSELKTKFPSHAEDIERWAPYAK